MTGSAQAQRQAQARALTKGRGLIDGPFRLILKMSLGLYLKMSEIQFGKPELEREKTEERRTAQEALDYGRLGASSSLHLLLFLLNPLRFTPLYSVVPGRAATVSYLSHPD